MQRPCIIGGESRDKEIFELIIRLVYLELRSCFRFYIVWVAVTRQIAAGIYGFSRGFLTDVIASYGSILYFVPLNETDLESSSMLFPCVWEYIGFKKIVHVIPWGWFKEGHGMKVGRKNYDGI